MIDLINWFIAVALFTFGVTLIALAPRGPK